MKSNPNYRNKVTINQRGGSIDINNSTDRESVSVSHYSGSNITFNNLVNSELATNNKQVTVLFDSFTSVGNTASQFAVKDSDTRVGENSYTVKGVTKLDQIEAMSEWVDAYIPIAQTNSRFDISRGGIAYPGAITTLPIGERASNPDLTQQPNIVNNDFSGYTKVPIVQSNTNEVSTYVPVPSRGTTTPAAPTTPTTTDIQIAFDNSTGTAAPGIIKYGPSVSSATERGNWVVDSAKSELPDTIKKLQPTLVAIESRMGNGGDDIVTIKRNRVETIGATINTLPSIRVDFEGKSINTEVGVGTNGTFIHKDFVPVVEEVDNSSNFPCGNVTATIGNKYNVTVGSGGIIHKTTGPITHSGTSVKVIGTQTIISGSAGVSILSEKHVDILADKIHLRSPRQVYIDTSLGVATNLVVAGGAFIEGEVYLNHVTCPVEVQETRPTGVFGFAIQGQAIGYVDILGAKYTVYGSGVPDTLRMVDHTHHFYNIPLTIKNSNNDVRDNAYLNDINKANSRAEATQVLHESKVPSSTP